MVTKKDVDSYYNSSNLLYSLLYYNKDTLSMHHGFWDKHTKDIHEAALNENDYVAKLGNFKSGHKILDAGCGVGGTAIYLAKNYGFDVTGITLNQKQVELAKKYAKENGVSNLVRFYQKDFTDTNFPNSYFDRIYAIESVCHSPTKKEFLKEAFRILKPEGTLVIADGYIKRMPNSLEEKGLVNKYCEAFAIPEFVTKKEMLHELKKAGFTNITHIDKLEAVFPSIRHLHRFAQKFFWIKFLFWLPIKIVKGGLHNYTALTLEHKAYKLGLFDYAVHYSERPKEE